MKATDIMKIFEDTAYVRMGGSPEEKQVTYQWQTNGIVCRCTYMEAEYSEALLGSNFGEGHIAGVMQVFISYPADNRAMYETSAYNYFITENGEE